MNNNWNISFIFSVGDIKNAKYCSELDNSRPQNLQDFKLCSLRRSKGHWGYHQAAKLFIWSQPSCITSGIVCTFKRKAAKIKPILTKTISVVILGVCRGPWSALRCTPRISIDVNTYCLLISNGRIWPLEIKLNNSLCGTPESITNLLRRTSY